MPIAPKILQQRGQGSLRVHQHQEPDIRRHLADNRRSALVFEDGHGEPAATGGRPGCHRRRNQRGNPGRQAIRVDHGIRRAVDEEAVTAHHNRRFHTRLATQRLNEFPKGDHAGTVRRAQSEVKQRKRLPGHELSGNLKGRFLTENSALSRFAGVPSLGHGVRALSSCMALAGLLTAAACGDTTSSLQPATSENVSRMFAAYAMTGSSNSLPAGYQFATESLVRPQLLTTGAVNFDIAFDIGADGKVIILPANKVVPQAPVTSAPVGFLKLTAVYDQLALAPDKGYVTDSTYTMAIGEALLVRVVGASCYYGEPYYAKLGIDSIDVTRRRIVFRSLINRNCGYRSVAPGVPTN